MSYTLVSHPLCPYVQRVAIVLREKGVPFERVDIDLAHKPEWFLRLSPLGKTPLLLAHGATLFESAVICEFLEDSLPPALHPAPVLERAQHRAWIECASALLSDVAALYNAADADALQHRARALHERLAHVERALGPGPYFAGEQFCMVDAAFAPLFRYFPQFARLPGLALLDSLPRLRAWADALAQRPSVQAAVNADYPAALRRFLLARGSELARRLAQSPDGAPT